MRWIISISVIIGLAVGAFWWFKPLTPIITPKTVVMQHPTVTAYNGLLAPEMDVLVSDLTKQGAIVTTLWHDAQSTDDRCPEYIIGHSMGGNAALRQAAKCKAKGKPPLAVMTIDPGRAPLAHQCPSSIKCINYYNPAHPIGGQYVDDAKDIEVDGFDHLAMPKAPRVVRGINSLIFP